MDAKLTLVMPAFNEVKTIEETIKKVVSQDFVNQLIVVDDGSTDGTRELLNNLNHEKLKIIYHEFNQGKGAALHTGFKEAKGPFIGVQDADLEYDPSDLSKFLPPLLNGHADAVFGSRFRSGEVGRVLYFWHSLGNRFLTTLSNMTTNINLTDMETCYKVIRKDKLDKIELKEKRFGFEPEITAKLASRGARIYEVGISYYGRTYDEGKKIGWKDGVRAVYCIFKYRFTERKNIRALKK
jgi:glycosyltransferase involved in cell wall biosynthesis